MIFGVFCFEESFGLLLEAPGEVIIDLLIDSEDCRLLTAAELADTPIDSEFKFSLTWLVCVLFAPMFFWIAILLFFSCFA